MVRLRTALAALLAACALAHAAGLRAHATGPPPPIQFVFTADAHYGITRASFRGAAPASAPVVNRALVAQINQLPAARFPDDGGLRAGEAIGPLDFVIEGGDVAVKKASA